MAGVKEARLRVLVVDDDKISRITTTRQLRENGYIAEAVEGGRQALERLDTEKWDVVLSDLRMPDMDGLELLQQISSQHAGIDVILMTAYGTVSAAVTAIQDGAADFLLKPFRFHELDHRLRKLEEYNRTRRELQSLKALLGEDAARFGMVGRSAAMKATFERIQLFADRDIPILVTGETGTGKEMVARALCQVGPRAAGPFVPVGCGTVPSDLAESLLFGHERGSFTGATQRRKGSFERAHGGTLLLDDVDDFPLNLQVKLLRVLQEGSFERVGGQGGIQVDVRVIATSKMNLEELVAQGKFRSDLFYRLRNLEIQLPPLRERGDDILLLAHHFMNLVAKKEGEPMKSISKDAARLLMDFHWPGNVRELKGAIESALILCREPEIGPEHLPDYLGKSRPAGVRKESCTARLDNAGKIDFARVVQEFEDDLLRWALEKADGQQTQAAQLLGLPRTTFRSKLKRILDS